MSDTAQETPDHDLIKVLESIMANLPDNQLGRVHDIIYRKSNGIAAGVMDRFVKQHRQYKHAEQRAARALSQVVVKQNALEAKGMTIVELRESLATVENDLTRSEAKARVFEKRFRALAGSKVRMEMERPSGEST